MTKRGAAWSDVGSLPTLDTGPAAAPGSAMQTAVGAALHLDEVTRTRFFLRVVFTLVVVTLVAVPLLPGDRFAGTLLLVAAAVCGVACITFHHVIGKPGGYT